MTTREQVIDALWKASQGWPYFIAETAFKSAFEAWSMDVIERDGQTVFAAFRKGPDFHFASLKPGFTLTRKEIKAYLSRIVEEHGFARTRTPKADVRQQRFNELVGFKRDGEDEFDIVYRIERVRCPSLQ